VDRRSSYGWHGHEKWMPLPSEFTGMQMMNLAPAWQYVLKAIVPVLAVLADVYFKRKG
jgi:hypothetical protein